MKITRIIGSVGEELKEEREEDGREETEPEDTDADSIGVRSLRLRLTNCRPDESLSIYYALKEDLPQDYIYLQFHVRYLDFHHQTITRTHTVRLRTTGNPATYVRSVDGKVVGVLEVKRYVLKAAQGQTREERKEEMSVQTAQCAPVRAVVMIV